MTPTFKVKQSPANPHDSVSARSTPLPEDVRALLAAALADALVLDYEDEADAQNRASDGEDQDTRPDSA